MFRYKRTAGAAETGICRARMAPPTAVIYCFASSSVQDRTNAGVSRVLAKQPQLSITVAVPSLIYVFIVFGGLAPKTFGRVSVCDYTPNGRSPCVRFIYRFRTIIHDRRSYR